MYAFPDYFRHSIKNHSNRESLEQYKGTVELTEHAKLFSAFYSTTKKRWALLQNQKYFVYYIPTTYKYNLAKILGDTVLENTWIVFLNYQTNDNWE